MEICKNCKRFVDNFCTYTKVKVSNETRVCNAFSNGHTKTELLNHYLTRGGFIKDCNGKWCKEGDKVRYKKHRRTFAERLKTPSADEYGELEGILNYIDFRFYIDDVLVISDLKKLELIEPCEPDVCDGFEGE